MPTSSAQCVGVDIKILVSFRSVGILIFPSTRFKTFAFLASFTF